MLWLFLAYLFGQLAEGALARTRVAESRKDPLRSDIIGSAFESGASDSTPVTGGSDASLPRSMAATLHLTRLAHWPDLTRVEYTH